MRIATRFTQLAAALAVTMGCMVGHANAAVMVYTDRAGYEANTVQTGYDSFADLSPDSNFLAPVTRGAGAFGYAISLIDPLAGAGQGAQEFFTLANGAGTALSTNFASAYFSIAGFDAPVRAIGGAFFTSDFAGAASGFDLTFRLTDASGSFDYVLSNGTPGGFLAFISDSVIESLTVISDQSDFDRFATIGALTLGTVADAAEVPEPGSLLLFGLGALAFAGSRRARRA